MPPSIGFRRRRATKLHPAHAVRAPVGRGALLTLRRCPASRKVKNVRCLGGLQSLRARSIAWTSQRPPEPRTWVRIPAGPSPYAFISMGPLALHVVHAAEGFREPKGRLDHRPLLKDPAVRKWFEAHALRSSLSAEVNLRKLGLFLYRTRLTPRRLVDLGKERPDELRDLLIGYATHLHGLKKLDSYIAKTQKGVRDWLLFNGVDFRRFPKLRRAYQAESLSRERIPTPEQLRLILGALPARGRVCALLMAHSGLRPGTLGSDRGNDGLTLGDLPELRSERKHPRFELPAGRRAFLVRYPPGSRRTLSATSRSGPPRRPTRSFPTSASGWRPEKHWPRPPP